MADALVLTHPSSSEHETGPHPERAARMAAIAAELDPVDWLGWERAESPAAAWDDLTAVHPASHVEMVRELAQRGGGAIDADTVLSEGSYRAAAHAAGGAVELVDRVLAGDVATGFSIHRPPGHHAEPDRAMGFCLFNSVAVAARHALRSRARVMIVDFDVHHGNGTEEIFAAEDRVLFLSIHQSPLYPGTGPASYTGSGAGEGYTVNLPVGPGSGDAVFCGLIDEVAVPLARAFAPELLLVSAGFDAHAEDPLAECRVTEAGYAAIARSLRRVGIPVAAVLEGGYALDALARSVRAFMEGLVSAGEGPAAVASGREPREVRAALERLAPAWPQIV